MSRTHRKFKGMFPSAVGRITLPSRAERHGKPLADVFMKPEVVKINRGVRVNPQTGEAESYSERVVVSVRRPMTALEIEFARNQVLRALLPTTRHAKRNGGEDKKK